MLELNVEQKQMLIVAKNLYSIYEGKGDVQNVVALSALNLDMKIGEFLAIHGPSGSGKSSLLRILGGLQKPTAGHLYYQGTEITRMEEDDLVNFRRSTVGYIFQEGNLVPSISAFQNLVQTLRFSGVSRNIARDKSKEMMKELGMSHRMHALPFRLSGGERQRVAIGRAMITEPKLILADEPTGNLDYANSEHILDLFQELHKEKSTSFIIVTHSRQVARHATRSLELRDGQFAGEHNKMLDFNDLQGTRKIRIHPDGRLLLPAELMPLIDKYGELWKIQTEQKGDGHRIIIEPENKIEEINHNYNICPICHSPVSREDGICNSCGANLIK